MLKNVFKDLKQLKAYGKLLDEQSDAIANLSAEFLLVPIDQFNPMRENHLTDEMIAHSFNLPVETVTHVADTLKALKASADLTAECIREWGVKQGVDPWAILYDRPQPDEEG